MKAWLARPLTTISRAMVCERAMSEPTFNPSQRSANWADVVFRGSTTTSFAPFLMPFRTW